MAYCLNFLLFRHSLSDRTEGQILPFALQARFYAHWRLACDLSISLLIYLCSPLFNGLEICKVHSMEEVCTSADGVCGCTHIRQREKLLCACDEPNYPNSFVEEFFFFSLLLLLLSLYSLNNIYLRFQVLGFQ